MIFAVRKKQRETKKEKIINSIYIQYTIVFFACAVTTFWMFWYFRRSLLIVPDGYLQNYPILVKIYNLIKNFFETGTVEFWSWDTGLGGDVIGNYASTLFDPFSYITFLFGRDRIDFGYAVSIMARLYGCGLTFAVFLKYMRFENWKALIGAISFAFSSWMLNIEVIMHPSFLYAVMLFPLLILGVEKVYRRENPIILILTIFFLAIYSIYFTFMSGIIVVIYCILRYKDYNEKYKLKDFFLAMFRLGGFAVAGFLLAALILFPTVYALLSASTDSQTSNFFYTIKQYLSIIPSFFAENSVYSNYSYTGAGILFTLFIPFFFKKKYRIYTQIKMWFLCLIMLLFPVFARILNGFSYPTGRWMYAMSFFVIWSGLTVLKENILFSSQFKVCWLATIIGISVVALFIFNILSLSSIVILLINGLLSFCLIYVLSEKNIKRKRILISGIVFCGLIFNNNIRYSIYYSNTFDQTYAVGEFEERMSKSVQRIGPEIEDDEFYRLYQTNGMNNYHLSHWPVNENIYWGNRSIYSYLSTIDSKWFEFNKELGNSAGYSTRVHVYGNDLRTRLDFLMGVKYFIGDDGLNMDTLNNHDKQDCAAVGYGYDTKELIEDIEVLKNKYSLGLGTVYEKVIPRSEFEKLSIIEREECLMQAAVVEDEDLKKFEFSNVIDSSSVITDSHEIQYAIVDEKESDLRNGDIKSSGDSDTFTISVENVSHSEIFVVFEGLEKKVLSYEEQKKEDLGENPSRLESAEYDRSNAGNRKYNNFEATISTDTVTKRFVNYGNSNQALPGIMDYCVNLGYYDEYSGNIEFSFVTEGNYTFDDLKIVVLPIDNYDQQAQKLQKSKIDIDTFSDNYIKGEVSSESNSLLYLSIIKNPGWEVYIDGEKINEVIYANIAFTGVPVTSGNHVIELKYTPPYIRIGGILSAIGLIASIAIVLQYRYKKKCVI